MGIVDQIKNTNIDSGITRRYDRHNKFRLRREKSSHGFFTYILENIAKNEKILIPRFMFDRFRSALRSLNMEEVEKKSGIEIDQKSYFKAKPFYHYKTAKAGEADVLISYCGESSKYSGSLTVSSLALGSLNELLYSQEILHPNDSLDKIIAYHKIFQLSFVEASGSINSDLQLRKDVLCQIEHYTPVIDRDSFSENKSKFTRKHKGAALGSKKNPEEQKKLNKFKPRLGERVASEGYRVDYQVLFSRGTDQASIKAPSGAKNSESFGRSSASFPLPLMSSDIKGMQRLPFRCEFTLDDIKEMRQLFLSDQQSEFFVGFEIVDAIFKKNGKLKTFRFPLYYIKVSLTESGRIVFLDPQEDGRLYLNHLALANLVDSFGGGQGSSAHLDHFFKTLSAQQFEVGQEFSRIYLSRQLPVDETIFKRIREILLGFSGENGKGGLLSELKLSGIECDLDSVYLYKAAKSYSAVKKAIELDLDQIQAKAYERPDKFYSSLLGKFLSPEMGRKSHKQKKFFDSPWVPGALPKSTRSLLEKLNHHDLVLLEGPPGTGKTFTIMNLVIHAICTGKRLLIVSDQAAAISALEEKMLEYFVGQSHDEGRIKARQRLWSKSVKVVDKVPEESGSLSKWSRHLQEKLCLGDDSVSDVEGRKVNFSKEMRDLDGQIEYLEKAIEQLVERKIGKGSSFFKQVSPKRMHASTVQDINALVEFIKFMGNGIAKTDPKFSEVQRIRRILKNFIDDREHILNQNLDYVVDVIDPSNDDFSLCKQSILALDRLLKSPPKTALALSVWQKTFNQNPIVDALVKLIHPKMIKDENKLIKALKWTSLTLKYPQKGLIKKISYLLHNFIQLMNVKKHISSEVFSQLVEIHYGIKNIHTSPIPLAYEICKFTTNVSFNQSSDDFLSVDYSVQRLVKKIQGLTKRRDELISRRFIYQLRKFEKHAYAKAEDNSTSLATSLATAIETVANKEKDEFDVSNIEDVRQAALQAFPVWFCRKQVVPFLFPCEEKQFDLVIVDEATQCKVDDAIPLLYRAKKLLVVGDDKQTVLSKNSVIDDYLFNEFNLEEHLRATQARGLKGGGSHIFGLVKSIKQASVMLDEHYRCPPDIIQFSNKYVYGSGLKTMKWSPKNQPGVVYVNYDEKNATAGGRVESGKYKGLETQMLDRFLDFVAKEIKRIEAQTGKKIDTEKDVALCYFLLKNQIYFEDKKGDFLLKLGRGDDILNGAGAALQGKERDYIFYFWDISRGNMMAFSQGDDPDKRKGELNVLMSRPKKRAYHYLHKNFDKLDHRKASIAEYLWKTYHHSTQSGENKKFIKRVQRPSDEFIPWRRSSGELMHAILEHMLKTTEAGRGDYLLNCQYSVIVGSPNFKVDLMIETEDPTAANLAIIDMCGFINQDNFAREIVDYYFQLKRSTPKIEPIFVFLHELADERSEAFRRIKSKIRKLKLKKTA